jgi:cytochrome d ubiquinol oxidase subunit I
MVAEQLRLVALEAPADFVFARSQMALSLGWHIVVACFGVAFPAMVLFAEWQGYRNFDADMARLARTWARAIGVLFAVGAVSGTILSFEMGMLWPGLMSRFGEIYGYPFTLEGFAFFLEAIFVGIYLFAGIGCRPGCTCSAPYRSCCPASPAPSSWWPRTPG